MNLSHKKGLNYIHYELTRISKVKYCDAVVQAFLKTSFYNMDVFLNVGQYKNNIATEYNIHILIYFTVIV